MDTVIDMNRQMKQCSFIKVCVNNFYEVRFNAKATGIKSINVRRNEITNFTYV